MRYSRQELVIGKGGQDLLDRAKVVVVGCGALGSVVSELLARSGVGEIKVVDRDVVEESNLQRQVLFCEDDIGKPKAEVAHARLSMINSRVTLDFVVTDVNFKNVDTILSGYDIVVDCTDNLYTRYLIDEFCHRENISWVYGGAIEDRGMVMAITPETACFRDVMGESKTTDTCDTVGVLNTITTIVGSLQVQLVFDLLLDAFSVQELISINVKTLHVTKIATKRHDDCEVYHGTYPYLDGEREPRIVTHRCSGVYEYFQDDVDLTELKKTFEKLGDVVCGDTYLFFDVVSIFSNGRIYVKAESEKDAKSVIAKYFGM